MFEAASVDVVTLEALTLDAPSSGATSEFVAVTFDAVTLDAPSSGATSEFVAVTFDAVTLDAPSSGATSEFAAVTLDAETLDAETLDAETLDAETLDAETLDAKSALKLDADVPSVYAFDASGTTSPVMSVLPSGALSTAVPYTFDRAAAVTAFYELDEVAESDSSGVPSARRKPPARNWLGAIQRSEAIALYGLLCCIRPTCVVEVGFGEGDSTETLLAATRDVPGARVTSYDINVRWKHAEELRSRYPHLDVRQADQAELRLDAGVDVLFLDASHDLALNKAFWALNEAALGDNAYVIVHDTGLWAEGTYNDSQSACFGRLGTLRGTSGRFHQPDEVEFVKWVVQSGRWTRVDVCSRTCFRHGFSILQRCQE